MKIWIALFSIALFLGGACLGVALQPRLVPVAKAETKIDSPAAPAPWGGPTHHSPQFSVHRFAAELQLSEEQDQKLEAILSESQEESQALGRAMRAAQDKSKERIVELLTPEQKAKLDALMAAERQKRSDAEIVKSVATYTKILSLNDDEAAALKAAFTESRGRRREFKHGEDWQQIRRSAREEQNKKLEKAFTAEHYKRYLEVSELDRSDR